MQLAMDCIAAARPTGDPPGFASTRAKASMCCSDRQMSNDSYLEDLRRHGRESVTFFSNQNKPERERCVVRAFLRALGVPFRESDLLVQQPEPTDVAALACRFQITEALDPDRKRHREYVDQLAHPESAKSVAKLTEPWKSRRAISYAEVAEAVLSRLADKTPQHGIDALVYVNWLGTFPDMQSPVPDLTDLRCTA